MPKVDECVRANGKRLAEPLGQQLLKPGCYDLGSFGVDSGKFRITDPCYGSDVHEGEGAVTVQVAQDGAYGVYMVVDGAGHRTVCIPIGLPFYTLED